MKDIFKTVEKTKDKKSISTGCQTIDDLFFGGIPLGAVSGFVAEPDTGKSFLAIQTAVLNATKGGKTLIINTENMSYEHWFKVFADRFNFPFEELSIEVASVLDLKDILRLFGIKAKMSLSKKGLRLEPRLEIEDEYLIKEKLTNDSKINFIIIDSMSMPIKSYIEQKVENYPSRATIENIFFGRLEEVAKNFNCAILLTHHITGVDPFKPWKKDEPYGGPIIRYHTKYLMHLWNSTSKGREKYGETVKRIQRERFANQIASEVAIVDVKTDYGYIDPVEIKKKNKDLVS